MTTQKTSVLAKYMKRCLIVGDTSSNVGDLLLRCQLLEIMSAHYKTSDFYSIEWRNNPETSSIIRSLGATPLSIRKNFAKVFLFAIGSDVRMGPGQLMRDNQSLFCLFAYFLLATVARLTGGSTTLHGIGIGRLNKPLYRLLWRGICLMSKNGFFRDEASLQTAHGVLHMGDNARLCADYAFLPTHLAALFSADHGNGTHLICAVCMDASEDRVLNPDQVALIAEKAAAACGTTKIIFVIHATNNAQDRKFANYCESALKKRSGAQFEITYVETLDLEKIAKVYGTASGVVSNRLHSAIFGIMAHKPVIVIDDNSHKLSPIASQFSLGFLGPDADAIEIEQALQLIFLRFQKTSYDPMLAFSRSLALIGFGGDTKMAA